MILYVHARTHFYSLSLSGYHISVGGPRGCKKPCVIAMQQSGLHTTFMSVLDQNEMNMWFNALERGTRMESTLRHFSKPALPPTENTVSGRDVRVEVTPAPGSSSGTKTKKTREQSVDKKEVCYQCSAGLWFYLWYNSVCVCI